MSLCIYWFIQPRTTHVISSSEQHITTSVLSIHISNTYRRSGWFSTATRLRTERSRNLSWQMKRRFFSPKRPDRKWGPPSLLLNAYGGQSDRNLKLVTHLNQCRSEDRCICTSDPLIRFLACLGTNAQLPYLGLKMVCLLTAVFQRVNLIIHSVCKLQHFNIITYTPFSA